MKKTVLGLLLLPFLSFAQLQVSNTSDDKHPFPLVGKSGTATILYDASDEKLIAKVASFLAEDIEKVTGAKPKLATSEGPLEKSVVVIGSLGHSKFIDGLVASKKIDAGSILGQWEQFIMQTVKNLFPEVSQALVIAGSDKRVTAFGVFSLSKEIGVSPGHFWADVPAKQQDALYVEKGKYVSAAPSVKYRGIFLNDEAPALRGWAEETFGGTIQ